MPPENSVRPSQNTTNLAGEGIASEPRAATAPTKGSVLRADAPSPAKKYPRLTLCPHCLSPLAARHVCQDTRRWSRAEKDELRAIHRRRNPAIQFVDTNYSERTAAMAQARGLG